MSNLRVNITDNWRAILEDVDVPDPDFDKADLRTGYYCRYPTQDPETYLHYLNWVQALFGISAVRKSGPTYMLNLGFLPVCAPPSFWDVSYADQVVERLQNATIGGEHLVLYPRSQFGLSDYVFMAKNVAALPDWWVSKLDAARLCGMSPETVTVREVYKRCGLVT